MRLSMLLVRTLALIVCIALFFTPPVSAQATCDSILDERLFSTSAAAPMAFSVSSATLDQFECAETSALRGLVPELTAERAMVEAVADRVAATVLGTDIPIVDDAQMALLRESWETIRSSNDQQHILLDTEIDSLYSTITVAMPRDVDYRSVIGLALFDYSRMVSNYYGDIAHTEVPSLLDEPFCAGDAVSDRMLWRYFEAVLLAREGQPEYVTSAANVLHKFALQTACLTGLQLYRLDDAMSAAWTRLMTRLEAHGLQFLRPWLAAVVLQPRVLLYDAVKHVGDLTPTYLWLRDETAFRAKLAEEPLWPVGHQIWLYNRRNGALQAFDTLCADGGIGADCINVSVLLQSMVTPEHLGMGECSFLEMIEGGLRDVKGMPAYTCTASLCGTPMNGEIPATALGSSFEATWQDMNVTIRLPDGTLDGQTPFGVTTEDARAAICNAGGLGGGSGLNATCGVSAFGSGTTQSVTCAIAGREAAMGDFGNVCINRLNNRCSSIITPISEQMVLVPAAGVPFCQRAANAETPAAEATATATAVKDKQIKDRAEEESFRIHQDEKFRAAVKREIKKELKLDVTDEHIDKAYGKLQSVKVVERIKGNAPMEIAYAQTTIDGSIKISRTAWATLKSTEYEIVLRHEFVHSVISIAVLDIHKDSGKPTPFPTLEQEHEITRRLGLNYDCGPDSEGESCSEQCSGMSKQMTGMLACLGTNDAVEMLKTSIEPIDPSPEDPEPLDLFSSCMMAGYDDGLGMTSRMCAAVQCTDTMAFDAGTGQCCSTSGVLVVDPFVSRMTELCSRVLCAPDTIAATSSTEFGLCGCGGFVPIEPPPLGSVGPELGPFNP